MGTFRRLDCPHLINHGNHDMCKYKLNKVTDRTDLTFSEKLDRAQVGTCSACAIYKNLKPEEKIKPDLEQLNLLIDWSVLTEEEQVTLHELLSKAHSSAVSRR